MGKTLIAKQGLPIVKKDDRFRHLFVIGSTGSGKTTFLLNLIKDEIDNAMIVLDPNGNLAERAASLVPPERLIYVDEDHPIGINPLQRKYLDYSETAEELIEIINLAVKEKVPTQSAVTVLMTKIITNALRVFKPDQFTLSYLSQFLEYEHLRKKVPDIFWQTFDDRDTKGWLKNKEQVESAKRVSARLALFCDALKMKPFLEVENQLYIPDITREKKVVIFNLSGFTDALTAFIGCIVSNEIKAYYTHPKIVTYEPLYFYCDEYQMFIDDSFSRFLTDVRKYKISCNFCGQSLAQVDKELSSMILANCLVKVVMDCGYKDAELIAREIGIVPEEIMQLKKYEAYIGIRKKPHKVKTYPVPDVAPYLSHPVEKPREIEFLREGWMS